jgi:hypothetical protein
LLHNSEILVKVSVRKYRAYHKSITYTVGPLLFEQWKGFLGAGVFNSDGKAMVSSDLQT